MSLPAKTAKAADTQSTKTTTTVVTATAPAMQDTRSYFAMMLLAIFMMPSGLARAYRGEQIGWIRFWVFIGSYLSLLVPGLNLVGALALIVLCVWGLVDIFLLRSVTTDAAGKPLSTTPTDKKWAKGFFIYILASIAMVIAIVVIGLSVMGAYYAKCSANPASCPINPGLYNTESTPLPQRYLDDRNESF